MNKREKRIVDAFVNCIKHGEFSVDYADTRIYDNSSYHLSNAAYDYYEEQTAQFREVESEVEEIPEETEE